MITKPDDGYRLYGAGVLLQLAADMAGETAGVKSGADSEYIHRMRVASRRLRVALPLFAEVFPKKEYAKWVKEVRQITRSLGRARDLDVQIAFLRTYAETLPAAELPIGMPRFLPAEYQTPLAAVVPGRPALPPAAEEENVTILERIRRFFVGVPEQSYVPEVYPPTQEERTAELRSGIECLMLRLMQERTALQPGVVDAVERFERSKTAAAIHDACMEIFVQGKMEKIETKTPVAYREAYYHISLCREQIFLYAKALADPDRVTAHHEMRIAAKKLRYTIETYRDLYGDGLAPSLKMVKELQEYLGDIHDCDVWIGFLPEFLAQEEARSSAYFGNAEFMWAIRPGVATLEQERAERRSSLHTDTVMFWKKSEGVWDQLEKSLVKPLEDLRLRTLTIPPGVSAIAFFADVHANLPALTAVVGDAKSRGCKTFIYAGDVIGFGPFPEETIRYLDEIQATGTRGNAEDAVLDAGTLRECLPGTDPRRQRSHKKTWKRLSPRSHTELAGMPGELRFVWGGLRVVVMHHPVAPENICAETPDAELERLCTESDADLIICGHTHRPFARKMHGVWIANTGGCGRSGDGDLRASYLLATINPFALHHIRVPYDMTETMRRLKNQKGIMTMFSLGLDFDEAAAAAEQGAAGDPATMPDTVSVVSAGDGV